MAATAVELTSGGLRLEALVYGLQVDTQAVVVVCHPHPQHGGDMHSNVVVAIAQALEAAGIAALCFNFRGAGRSGGAFDGGKGEQDDVRAALECARSLGDGLRLGLAGYSFGAGMAAAVADGAIDALCLVSIPERALTGTLGLGSFSGPVLLVCGDADHAVSPQALREAAAGLPAAEAIVVSGADHFWRGYEERLKSAVRDFFAAAIR